KKLAVDQGRADALVSALHFTLIPCAVLSGILADARGAREVLCLGSVLTGVALVALAAAGTYRGGLRAVLLAGVGVAALTVATCVLMPAGLFENSPAASLNLGFVFVGLGAVLAPALARPLARAAGWRRTVIVFAILALAPAAAVLLAPGPLAAAPTDASD